jgi:hypothetical protein
MATLQRRLADLERCQPRAKFEELSPESIASLKRIYEPLPAGTPPMTAEEAAEAGRRCNEVIERAIEASLAARRARRGDNA